MASTSLLIQWLQEQLPFSLFFLLLLSLVFRRFLHGDKLKPNLPPSPPKLPIIGNLHQLGSLPHRALHALSQKYGPIMQMHLGSSPTIIVSSAEIAKDLTKNYDVVFSNRPVSTASKAFVFGGRDVAFSPHGEYWRQMRKICVLDLLSVRRVQSYKFVREEEIGRMLEKIGTMANNPVNLSKEVIMVMNNIISRITLGRKLEGNVEVLMWIKELMNLFGNFSVEDLFPSLRWLDVLTGLDRRMKNTSKAFHGFLDEVVEDHISRNRNRDGGDNDEHKDFVDILLECQKDVSLGIPPFSRGELRAILMDMFVGGTDATYATIEWAMTELMKHPELMKKVKEDVRKFVRNKSIVEENDIHQMEYLNCVIKETLRLHPPLVLGLQRLSSAPTTIGGYSIPANTRLIINLWAITRDPKHWDRPDEFIPDRFISSPLDYKGADYEFIPFGVGRRGCPGTAFGMASVETVLANLLCWFDWELPADADKGRLGVESFGLGVHLKYPLTLVPLPPSS